MNLGKALRMSDWNGNPKIPVSEMAFDAHLVDITKLLFSLLRYN